jgi:Zn-finger nucleic acid-binding protein
MKCPNCNETLLMTDRQGVEIDYCPNCRGVWLDKGELDKLIERSASYTPGAEEKYTEHRKPFEQGGEYQQPYKSDDYYKHKKKKGFLGDFFDFD